MNEDKKKRAIRLNSPRPLKSHSIRQFFDKVLWHLKIPKSIQLDCHAPIGNGTPIVVWLLLIQWTQDCFSHYCNASLAVVALATISFCCLLNYCLLYVLVTHFFVTWFFVWITASCFSKTENKWRKYVSVLKCLNETKMQIFCWFSAVFLFVIFCCLFSVFTTIHVNAPYNCNLYDLFIQIGFINFHTKWFSFESFVLYYFCCDKLHFAYGSCDLNWKLAWKIHTLTHSEHFQHILYSEHSHRLSEKKKRNITQNL